MALRSRSFGVWLLLWAALAWLALRPARVLQPAIGTLLSPLRALSELAAPLVWLRQRELLAVDPDAARRTLIDSVRSNELRQALALHAEPSRPELRDGRHLIPAEVLSRPKGRRDRLSVSISSEAAGIEPGFPVVCGNVYVGRVAAIENFALGRLAIDLVTGPEFQVGGRVAAPGSESGGAHMAVGGILGKGFRARAAGLRLALRAPSSREIPDGALVVVDEPSDSPDEHAHLAAGFELGVLRAGREGEQALEPRLDYSSGLYQVVILAPPSCGRGAEAAPTNSLSDGNWLPVRALTLGDAGGLRRGLVIAAGSQAGVGPGAVVWSRGHLVGRVSAVGRWSADVRLISDSGLELVAVARLSLTSEPRVLGRIITLGEDSGGHLRMWWDRPAWFAPMNAPGSAAGGEPGGAFVPAELYTGSGESGLPAGLSIGAALLPGDGGSELRLLPRNGDAAPFFDPLDLWVRQSAAGDAAP